MTYQIQIGLHERRDFEIIRTYFKEELANLPGTISASRVDRIFTDDHLRSIRDKYATRVFYSWLIRAYAYHHRKRTDG